MDTLRNRIPLIVVVNERLMGNHQHEIADAMEENHYLVKSTPSTLLAKLEQYPQTSFSMFVKDGLFIE